MSCAPLFLVTVPARLNPPTRGRTSATYHDNINTHGATLEVPSSQFGIMTSTSFSYLRFQIRYTSPQLPPPNRSFGSIYWSILMVCTILYISVLATHLLNKIFFSVSSEEEQIHGMWIRFPIWTQAKRNFLQKVLL
jgi:hypothetical protein